MDELLIVFIDEDDKTAYSRKYNFIPRIGERVDLYDKKWLNSEDITRVVVDVIYDPSQTRRQLLYNRLENNSNWKFLIDDSYVVAAFIKIK